MSSVHHVVEQLLPGQRLTREEFLRRWEALPDLKNAELIDGIVYMSSPVSVGHGRSDSLAHAWLCHYAAATPGWDYGSNTTWLMLESAPQPDSHLRILPQFGGQSRVEENYGAGAPELIVEVCVSSATHDFGPKLALYQRAGVREYITVSLEPPEVIWRKLVQGRYVPIDISSDRTLKSEVFPGLWLDPEALLATDAARVLARLQAGLNSPEHAAFVRRTHPEAK
jgi:Uma2 family endonuclease